MNVKNISSKLAIAVASLLVFSAVPLAAFAAVPSASSILPSVVTTGGSAFTLTVYGNNFDTSSVVYFNGSARPTSYVASNQVTAIINAADIASPGDFNISVINTGTNGGASNNLSLLVSGVATSNPFPILTSISPASTVAGSASFILNVYGDFVPSSLIRFNGVLMPTTFVSANQLMASIPSSDIATAVVDAVSVVNPVPGGGESGALLFSVNPVSTTPGLPNTGFGPTDPKPTVNDTALVVAGLAAIAILSVAIVAGKKLWLVKR
jgi:hypothetical protein